MSFVLPRTVFLHLRSVEGTMFAEQQSQHFEPFASFPAEAIHLLYSSVARRFSSESSLSNAVRNVELQPIIQKDGTQPFGFYQDFYQYQKDILQYGKQQAQSKLHDRLLVNLITMDQEARRKITTYPIPLHFTRQIHERHFSWRAIGKDGNWKTELSHMNAIKPEGAEKDRFQLEANLTIHAFDQLLDQIEVIDEGVWRQLSENAKVELLQNDLNFTQSKVEVTRFLALLFPELTQHFGKTIECVMSPCILTAYTRTPFHLQGRSSFLYAKRIAYLPNLGFIGLDQGLMSGYYDEDLKAIITSISGTDVMQRTTEELMSNVFSPKQELSNMDQTALFDYCKTVVPFKSLQLEEFVNPSSCSDKEYENYIEVLQAVFEKELQFLSENPSYISSSQERNEVFSRYIAFALGLKDTLPQKKMLQQYKALLADKAVALDPKSYIKKIDTSFAGVYHHLASVPLKLESLIECSVVGSIQSSLRSMNPSNLASAFGKEFKISGNSFDVLKKGIEQRRIHDFDSIEEARIFASMYAISPNWIGTVIQHYPEGKLCDECGHTMHWVGQCGNHTMCLQCNAEYNLTHGLVPGINDANGIQKSGDDFNKHEQLQYESKQHMGIGDFVAGLANPDLYYQVFLIEHLLASCINETQLPLAA